MAKRQSLLPSQAEITRLMKAARLAGFTQAHFIQHTDGRMEVVAADAPVAQPAADLSPYEEWKQKNARKA